MSIFLFSVLYPFAVWTIAQLAPNQGRGAVIDVKGRKHYANIGQSFSEDKYFWSRPSAANYNAAASAGSNKGPSNEAYLAEVQARIDTFITHNPEVTIADIPVDLVTSSGSGLDPNFSVQAAKVQAERIARVRNMSVVELHQLIEQHTEKPLFSIFGPEKINVLRLNIALDQRSL